MQGEILWKEYLIKDVQVHNVRGVKIINASPHPINLGFEGEEEIVILPPSGFIVSATPHEEMVSEGELVTLVTTRFLGNKETKHAFKELRMITPRVIIISSIIAAQAYPGSVMAMVPCKGFERVPPAEKRMRHDKFTTF